MQCSGPSVQFDAWNFGASIGPAADGRIKPDVSYWYDDIFTTTNFGYRTDFGGTSGATPEAAGVLGLMIQVWADNVWETDPVGATVFDRQPTFCEIDLDVIRPLLQTTPDILCSLLNEILQKDFTGIPLNSILGVYKAYR